MTRYLWSPGVTGSQLAATELPGGVGSPVTTKLAHISSMASLTATTSCTEEISEECAGTISDNLGPVNPVFVEVSIPKIPKLIRVCHAVLGAVQAIGVDITGHVQSNPVTIATKSVVYHP